MATLLMIIVTASQRRILIAQQNSAAKVVKVAVWSHWRNDSHFIPSSRRSRHPTFGHSHPLRQLHHHLLYDLLSLHNTGATSTIQCQPTQHQQHQQHRTILLLTTTTTKLIHRKYHEYHYLLVHTTPRQLFTQAIPFPTISIWITNTLHWTHDMSSIQVITPATITTTIKMHHHV